MSLSSDAILIWMALIPNSPVSLKQSQRGNKSLLLRMLLNYIWSKPLQIIYWPSKSCNRKAFTRLSGDSKPSMANSLREWNWLCFQGEKDGILCLSLSLLSNTVTLTNHGQLWAQYRSKWIALSWECLTSPHLPDVASAAVRKYLVSWLHVPWKNYMKAFVLGKNWP